MVNEKRDNLEDKNLETSENGEYEILGANIKPLIHWPVSEGILTFDASSNEMSYKSNLRYTPISALGITLGKSSEKPDGSSYRKSEKKSPEDILYELEHFGIPTRYRSLKEADELIRKGQLSQDKVKEVCTKYQSKIDAENIKRYGTPKPTEKQQRDYTLKLIEDGKKLLQEIETPSDYVKMFNGKYTNGEELHTSGLAGCLATLLYFEGDGTKEGILTHYPPTEIKENLAKIRELKEKNLKEDYQKQKGIIFVESSTVANEYLECGLKVSFPKISLETIVYDQNKIGEVSLNPAQSEWRTEQHKTNYF